MKARGEETLGNEGWREYVKLDVRRSQKDPIKKTFQMQSERMARMAMRPGG